MTEDDWLDSVDPQAMLEFLRGKVGVRKLSLFSCMCCRRVLPLLPAQLPSAVLEGAERLADEPFSLEELASVFDSFNSFRNTSLEAPRFRADENLAHVQHFLVTVAASWTACLANYLTRRHDPFTVTIQYSEKVAQAFGAVSGTLPGLVAGTMLELIEHAKLLRDILGNPFRPVTLDLAWRTSAVTALAQTIYTDHRFDAMPILADALEEAGCTSDDILAHCRGDGPHVLGCWVVDLILGKQ
jgi:hypothetical protein